MKKKSNGINIKLQILAMIVLIAMMCGLVGLLFWAKKQDVNSDSQENSKQIAKVVSNELTTGSITYTEYYLNNRKNSPIVLLQHGISGNRKELKEYATYLAEKGYFVIVPDAYAHGDRIADQPLPVAKMIVETAKGFDVILENYKERKEADISHLGIIGFSLGGLAGSYYAVNGNNPVEVLCAYCAVPDFTALMNKDIIYQQYTVADGLKEVPNTDPNYKEEINKYIKDNSPAKKLLQDKKLKMCLIAGEKDEIMDLNSMKSFSEKMKIINEFYLYKEEKNGHELTVTGLEELATYLKQYMPANN